VGFTSKVNGFMKDIQAKVIDWDLANHITDRKICDEKNVQKVD